MELKIDEVKLPEVIKFNYEDLKREITNKAKIYETMIYTDSEIKAAKADRANLNKLKKALNDERIRREREYMKPFEDFKTKINEIIGIIDKPVCQIDKWVKEYEEGLKEKKREEIKELFSSPENWSALFTFEWLKLEQIFDEKWLNNSVSMKAVRDDMEQKLMQIRRDIDTLSNLPEFGFEATEVYKTTLDINQALNEGKRLAEIQKKKEEAKKLEANQVDGSTIPACMPNFMNPPVVDDLEVERKWVSFSANLTVAEALQLKGFFKARKIEFKAI